jgi:menaquinone-dependent protoporphyrinogen oxidase
MSNVLIVYATKEGQTERIARCMSDALTADGHSVELVDADHQEPPPDLTRFQVVAVGGPIHAGGYPRSIERFARENRHFLASARSAFFSVGLAVASRTSDGHAQTMELVRKFAARTGWYPKRIELVAGALPYSKYNFVVRYVMRRIAEKEGGDTDTSRDYEYTDFPAVERFARELAGPLPAAGTPDTRQPSMDQPVGSL